MAEPEELDEDLFADLYDAEDNVPNHDASAEADTFDDFPAPAPADDGADAGMSGVDQGGPPAQPPSAPLNTTENGDAADRMPGAIGHGPAHGQAPAAPEPEHTGIAIKEDGKMFIGGLNWETTDESLRKHFEEFGEVVECTVMRDAATGRSRGFGFLTFKDPKTVNTVMVKEHYLDGKIIDPKRAIPRDEQERTSKIFVGGVSQEATDEDFKNYFTQYGRVIDATLMMDKDTKRPRGFGFVTFDSEAAVEATLRGDLKILGKPIEVKRAQPRGNVQQEEEQMRRGGRRGRDGFQNDQGAGQGAQNNPMFQNGMTPQMMAQYFQRMQQYFAQMMANMGGGMGMMNPAMMQQMKQMQQMQQMQGNGGQGMTPQMMQQMQQMQQMQMQMGGGGGAGAGAGAGGEASSGGSANGSANGQGGQGNMPGVPSGPSNQAGARKPNQQQDQMMFDQAGGRRGGNQNMAYQQGGPTSWEGMYDEVPQPDGGGGGGNMGGGQHMGGGPRGGQGGFGRRGGGGGGGFQPPRGPSNAPANAPTGPRNAGVPGANYRGGRGNHQRGFHPYGRR